jgi:hypothetical protein
MGHAISKVSQPEPRTTQKSRVARVTAKRPKRDPDETEVDLDPEALADDTVEPATETGGLAATGEAEVEVEVVEKVQRPDNGTYLSMYFRDMALLDVLRPEEEFTAAREIEALEIMLWESVLAYAPAIERVIAAVATVPDFTMPTEARTLCRLAGDRDAKAFTRAATPRRSRARPHVRRASCGRATSITCSSRPRSARSIGSRSGSASAAAPSVGWAAARRSPSGCAACKRPTAPPQTRATTS